MFSLVLHTLHLQTLTKGFHLMLGHARTLSIENGLCWRTWIGFPWFPCLLLPRPLKCSSRSCLHDALRAKQKQSSCGQLWNQLNYSPCKLSPYRIMDGTCHTRTCSTSVCLSQCRSFSWSATFGTWWPVTSSSSKRKMSRGVKQKPWHVLHQMCKPKVLLC